MLKSQQLRTRKTGAFTSKLTSFPKNGTTKSSTRREPWVPLTIAHCWFPVRYEQKNEALAPPRKNSSPENSIGTGGPPPTSCPASRRPETRWGSCSFITHKEKR